MFVNLIQPAELRERMDLGLRTVIVDVRTPGEFVRAHAAGAVSIPLDPFDAASIAECRGTDGQIYIICHSGARAATACKRLFAAGVSGVVVVEGGMKAWEASGLPVVSGAPNVISIDRQIKIAAGSLVLLGCLLSWLVMPQFLALAAFVGAGLVFAGVTDICGMGILLSKMPWNTRAAASWQSCSR